MIPSSSSAISPLVLILIITLIHSNAFIECDQNGNNNYSNDFWNEAGKMTGSLLMNCVRLELDNGTHHHHQLMVILQRCLKRGCLLLLDRALERDIIALGNGIELVRRENRTKSTTNSRNYEPGDEVADWKRRFFQRIAHVFSTHVLKIRLNDDDDDDDSARVPEARRRKRQNMMMSLMMFGVVAVGMIMIPMGFQFLAVLGGKALLLAKMALLLTAIQGLKKIATSNVNYGLYSTPGHHANQWQYDRQWPYNVESEDIRSSFNYPDIPSYRTDLLHPRIGTIIQED